MKRLLACLVVAVACTLLTAEPAAAQCGDCCSASAASAAPCCGPRPVRRTLQWVRARRDNNIARVRSGRLPRVFPLFWARFGR